MHAFLRQGPCVPRTNLDNYVLAALRDLWVSLVLAVDEGRTILSYPDDCCVSERELELRIAGNRMPGILLKNEWELISVGNRLQ